MAEPSGRHRIRKFLVSRKHKQQPSDPEDLLRASNTSSVVSLPRVGYCSYGSRRDRRLNSVGNLGSRRRTQSVETSASNSKPRAHTGPSVTQSDVNAAQSTDTEEPNNFSDHDRLFRTTSDTSANSLEESTHDENEPIDWGLYGNENTTYKYEVQEDSIPVLLDKELLDSRERENKTLATDRFLFDEAGASRFGAVVVNGAGRDEEDDDADFVDEDLVAWEAKKENERSMKRRARKLESNRDRYAEMAAARLAGMRKDARHSKKRHGHSDMSLSVGSDNSDVESYDEEQLIVGEEVEGVAELEDTNQRRSSLHSRRSSKSQKHSFVSNSDKANSVNNDYASGEDEVEMDENQEAVPSATLISTQIATAESTEAEAGSADAERIEVDIVEAEEAAEELRQLKKKYRAERRAKKRLMREKEEEERTALKAAELARAHREEQRAREEAKAEQKKREKKKERREVKAKLKREKAKQRQAEAEFRKLAEFNQAEEERRERKRMEKKEKKKAEEEREPRETETVQQPVAAPALVLTSTSSVQTEVAPTQQAACASIPPAFPAPSPVPVPVVAPAVVSSSAAEVAAAAAQSMPPPIHQMCPPPFVPSYPTGPQSMPAYGLAATFGAYPPFYLAPYNYGRPTGLQHALMRPNMGFVAGLSAINSFGTPAGPAPAPSIQNLAEPMIGPQLPILKESAKASLTGASPPSFPLPSVGKSTSPKLTNLPELPDVIEF
ncbi:unnamed protein product [Peronospora destructor]|uniref:Stress response protein NST1 n=1 Tax=Peronospora destructor TaxID=86335 RepID=A0AAV0V3H9_9STRA|nr:unnamed protein product [Peronospora destructor]